MRNILNYRNIDRQIAYNKQRGNQIRAFISDLFSHNASDALCEVSESFVLEHEEIDYWQTWNIDRDTVLALKRIERCPDETAVIVILTETESKEYRRKIKTDKQKDKFIQLNDRKYYLKEGL